MTELNLGESKITHRQQIIQLFKMAVAQDWHFAYLEPQGKQIKPHAVKLVSVNTNDGNFTIDAEVGGGEEDRAALMFRAQSGGLSVMFKSRPAGDGDDTAAPKSGTGTSFSLPYEVSCTQLRKSARYNVESLGEDIPVVLYLVMGVQVNATLVDISTSGAKFKASQDLSEKCKNPQVLEACRIELPDDFVLQCDAQLMGMSYDSKDSASYLRCQLVGMKKDDEDRLDKLINDALENADPSELVI